MSETEVPIREMTVDQALGIALSALRAGHVDVARPVLERIHEAVPNHADAAHFLGVLRVQAGEVAEAIPLLERSIELAPQMAEWRNNLGNAYMKARRHAEARTQYLAVIFARPKDANAFANLGNAERLLKADAASEKAYRKALDLEPDHVEAHVNFAKLLFAAKRFPEARVHLERVIALDGERNWSSRVLLMRLYLSYGETDRAIAALREWQIAMPDDPRPKHYLAALTGEDVPERADARYVVESFDDFAKDFEEQLASLGYQAPQLCLKILEAAIGQRRGLTGLDAGCGTGLCAPLVKHIFTRLDGVDLSPKMLELAAARKLYDTLACEEMTAFIAARPARYDVILSADTLIYFGRLDAVFKAVASSLRPGGVMVFTVEAETGDVIGPGYRLQAHGRYCHAEGYLREALVAAGVSDLAIARDILRMEAGEPVRGYIVAARWP